MHALIFDIDGTLLESDRIDGKLFVDAVHQCIGPVHINDDWSTYCHVTDAGILAEILQQYGITDGENKSALIKKRFINSVREHINTHGPFAEIQGARNFMKQLIQSKDYACAYATGSWIDSAQLKLESARFPVDGIPLATSDDSLDRCNIMLTALQRLGNTFDSITYCGDGEWDRTAANKLGWRFVPVGEKLGGLLRYPDTPEDLFSDRVDCKNNRVMY